MSAYGTPPHASIRRPARPGEARRSALHLALPLSLFLVIAIGAAGNALASEEGTGDPGAAAEQDRTQVQEAVADADTTTPSAVEAEPTGEEDPGAAAQGVTPDPTQETEEATIPSQEELEQNGAGGEELDERGAGSAGDDIQEEEILVETVEEGAEAGAQGEALEETGEETESMVEGSQEAGEDSLEEDQIEAVPMEDALDDPVEEPLLEAEMVEETTVPASAEVATEELLPMETQEDSQEETTLELACPDCPVCEEAEADQACREDECPSCPLCREDRKVLIDSGLEDGLFVAGKFKRGSGFTMLGGELMMVQQRRAAMGVGLFSYRSDIALPSEREIKLSNISIITRGILFGDQVANLAVGLGVGITRAKYQEDDPTDPTPLAESLLQLEPELSGELSLTHSLKLALGVSYVKLLGPLRGDDRKDIRRHGLGGVTFTGAIQFGCF